jgi:hypothetical protein
MPPSLMPDGRKVVHRFLYQLADTADQKHGREMSAVFLDCDAETRSAVMAELQDAGIVADSAGERSKKADLSAVAAEDFGKLAQRLGRYPVAYDLDHVSDSKSEKLKLFQPVQDPCGDFEFRVGCPFEFRE